MTTLQEKMTDHMTLCGFSPKTKRQYLRGVKGLGEFHNQSPDQLNTEQIQTYLLHLMQERQYAWSTCNIVRSALRYFYGEVLGWQAVNITIPRRKTQSKLPEILSAKELNPLFHHAYTPKDRALLLTVYAAGLRGHEVVHLKITDIDSQRMTIRVRQGKGNKDRYTLLSERLLQELRQYWKLYRPKDWLFPSGKDPQRSMSVQMAQRAYRLAKLGSGIKKEGGLHTLRHCFATHLLESGIDIRTIQMLLGHRCLLSTTRYFHLTSKALTSVRSPLDSPDFSRMLR